MRRFRERVTVVERVERENLEGRMSLERKLQRIMEESFADPFGLSGTKDPVEELPDEVTLEDLQK